MGILVKTFRESAALALHHAWQICRPTMSYGRPSRNTLQLSLQLPTCQLVLVANLDDADTYVLCSSGDWPPSQSVSMRAHPGGNQSRDLPDGCCSTKSNVSHSGQLGAGRSRGLAGLSAMLHGAGRCQPIGGNWLLLLALASAHGRKQSIEAIAHLCEIASRQRHHRAPQFVCRTVCLSARAMQSSLRQ